MKGIILCGSLAVALLAGFLAFCYGLVGENANAAALCFLAFVASLTAIIAGAEDRIDSQGNR